MHVRESLSKRKRGGHQSCPFVVGLAPQRLPQSPELAFNYSFLKRAVPLSECQNIRAPNLILHRIEQIAALATGPTDMTSDDVLKCSWDRQTNILAVRSPRPRSAHESCHVEGVGTYDPHRSWS